MSETKSDFVKTTSPYGTVKCESCVRFEYNWDSTGFKEKSWERRKQGDGFIITCVYNVYIICFVLKLCDTFFWYLNQSVNSTHNIILIRWSIITLIGVIVNSVMVLIEEYNYNFCIFVICYYSHNHNFCCSFNTKYNSHHMRI